MLVLGAQCSSKSEDGNEPGTRTPLIGYYWVDDKKVEIIINPEKQFVAFEKELEEKVMAIQPQCEITEYKMTAITPYEKNTDSKLFSGDLRWTILSRTEAEQLKGETGLFYMGPFYGLPDGDEDYPASSYFHIKLKEESDISILEEMAQAEKVEILGQNFFMPLWWTLSCDIDSSGLALDLSNYFYETGLFAASSPGFFGGIKPLEEVNNKIR